MNGCDFCKLRMPTRCIPVRVVGRAGGNSLPFCSASARFPGGQPLLSPSAQHQRNLSVTMTSCRPCLRIAFFKNFSAAFLLRDIVTQLSSVSHCIPVRRSFHVIVAF